MIYDGTDLCNAHIPNYMYLVHGGGDLNGSHFYGQFNAATHYAIIFGDSSLPVACDPDFLRSAEFGQAAHWEYPEELEQESFLIDTALATPVLEILAAGADSLLAGTYEALRDVATKYGHPRLDYAERYWFWNLTATRCLEGLVKRGVVQRRGTGQYRFSGME